MATENLIMAIQDPAAEVNQLGITRQYPKKDGGSFILGISVVGIELMELGNDGETLGTAIVLGPGLTNGSLGYVPGEKDDREFVPDTNLTLKAIEQKISAFKLCLSGSL